MGVRRIASWSGTSYGAKPMSDEAKLEIMGQMLAILETLEKSLEQLLGFMETSTVILSQIHDDLHVENEPGDLPTP